MKDAALQSRVFGPVASRRLGYSLGVDVVPFKTCTYDCTYCQLGRTTCKTIRREMFYPVADVLSQVLAKIGDGNRIDYITFAGSGEPTLYAGLGELIQRIKESTPIPVAVITNGSLLYDPGVRAEVARADLVVPNLDASNTTAFESVNRPAPELEFARMLEGLVQFRKEFKGLLWLELFLVEGAIISDEDIRQLVLQVKRISPEKIQLNTPVRPVAESAVRPVDRDILQRLLDMLGKNAEIVADFPESPNPVESRLVSRDEVLGLIARHPCTVNEIAQGLSATPEHIREHLQSLVADGLACEIPGVTGVCFIAA